MSTLNATITDRDIALAPVTRHIMHDLYLRDATITYGEFARRATILSGTEVIPRSVGRLLDLYRESLRVGFEPDLSDRVVRADTGAPGTAHSDEGPWFVEKVGG